MIMMLVGGFLFTVGSIVAVVFVKSCGPGLMDFMSEVRDEMNEREEADRAEDHQAELRELKEGSES